MKVEHTAVEKLAMERMAAMFGLERLKKKSKKEDEKIYKKAVGKKGDK